MGFETAYRGFKTARALRVHRMGFVPNRDMGFKTACMGFQTMGFKTACMGFKTARVWRLLNLYSTGPYDLTTSRLYTVVRSRTIFEPAV